MTAGGSTVLTATAGRRPVDRARVGGRRAQQRDRREHECGGAGDVPRGGMRAARTRRFRQKDGVGRMKQDVHHERAGNGAEPRGQKRPL